ncbi:MBL fold metallo-hydrolase [Fodinibius salsisoli]|uniref:MBL fold metallo-hydrolase n=1 Tax=Fodinibius salsisoli TaxID=2820877 RepID=A0ABT3PNY2_9BACT|nr:MBL fold metallo-hydrolase [Fodinibius salsisoli]MCW9707573.1 MBL fold metallo-hydrolase [Fodinibius salsisoli]
MLLPSWAREYIYPLRIPTPFAVGDVFSYLIKDEKNVLIDCGYYSKKAEEDLDKLLKEEGLILADLDEIWLTHGHPDHFGQAAHLGNLSGAVIYGHPKEQDNFGGGDNQELFRTFFEEHQIPKTFVNQMIEQLDWLQQFSEPLRPKPIQEGEELSSGSLSVVVKHTPGHAPGHVVFDTQKGLIFGGDLLLEHISTNALINFDPDTEQRNKSLLQYRNSLKWISGQKGVVLPGHGNLIKDIGGVANHHLTEHENRYQKIQMLLEKRPMRLMEIAQRLFAEAIEKGATFLVLSEVMGYLDWGIQEGTMTSEVTSNGIIFKMP